MINTKTGEILIENIKTTISPKMPCENFIAVYPENKLLRIRDMGNGYVWYDIKDMLYKQK